MKIRKVKADDVALGMLVPWNVYGDNGALLARKGHMLASAAQIERIIERGMFEDHSALAPASACVPGLLDGAAAALQALQQTLLDGGADAVAGVGPGLAARLEPIVAALGAAIALDVHVATASILHHQRHTPYPVRHCINSALVARILATARARSPAEIKSVTLAALTMNLGMLAWHHEWHERAGPLDARERRLLHAHPDHGVRLLRQAGVDDQDWLDCVRDHRENEDGSGYPAGRAGAQIAPLAKLVALADRYCARVVERAYRPCMSANAALQELLLEARTTVHSSVATQLLRELGIYPIGSWVRLVNGEVAVVARRGLQSTTPLVDAVLDPRGVALQAYARRDTRLVGYAIRAVLSNAQVAALGVPPLALARVWGRVAGPG